MLPYRRRVVEGLIGSDDPARRKAIVAWLDAHPTGLGRQRVRALRPLVRLAENERLARHVVAS